MANSVDPDQIHTVLRRFNHHLNITISLADLYNTSCRLASSVIRLTKHVIWKKKSKRTAIAAYRANSRTAGMVVNAPEKKNTVCYNPQFI